MIFPLQRCLAPCLVASEYTTLCACPQAYELLAQGDGAYDTAARWLLKSRKNVDLLKGVTSGGSPISPVPKTLWLLRITQLFFTHHDVRPLLLGERVHMMRKKKLCDA